MELNKKNMRKLALLVAFGILLYWGLQNARLVGQLLRGLLKLLSPFILGLCTAFVANLVLRPIERGWTKLWRKSKSALPEKLKRPVCLALSFLLLFGAVIALIFIIIPQLSGTFSALYEKLPDAIGKMEQWWTETAVFLGAHNIVLPELNIDLESAIKAASDFLSERGSIIFGKTMDITRSIASTIVNFVLGIFFSLYVLAQKEKLGRNSARLIHASFGEKAAGHILDFLSLVSGTFSRFVSGQVTEAFILGSLCFVGMSILRLPYALVTSVVICFTALIPILGAWIGAIFGAFLIVFESPIKALTFLVFLVILQQVEGNFIYPKVVGKSVGLPSLWVLVAVTVGGTAFGIMGMLFAVPIFSVIYTLLGTFVQGKEAAKAVAVPAPAPVSAEPAAEEQKPDT